MFNIMCGRRAYPTELSPAEKNVVALVAQGKTNPQIAAAVHRDISTIKTQLQKAFAKLGATSRAEAVVKAMRLGYVQ